MTQTVTVEVLQASLHVLKVGSRQVTMSVFKQLDSVRSIQALEPWGRVRASDGLYAIGQCKGTGELKKCSMFYDEMSYQGDPYDGLIQMYPELSGFDLRAMGVGSNAARLEEEIIKFTGLPLIVLAGLR